MAADLVFLTGATGFVGGHVAEELLGAGYRVRALVRDAAAAPKECEPVLGDLRAAGTFARRLHGCRYVVHCAALYSFAARDRAAIARVNVNGTASLLAAAYLAGVERAVVTSSSAALGPARGDRPAGENDWAAEHVDAYHDSKVRGERAAFASRVPVVTLLPTAPVGPRDRKPTPTGKMLLDFARGAIFARPPGDGGMNLVPVESVARAHVAALERGAVGERYAIGGENLSFDAIWTLLAGVTGRRAPRLRAPLALALGAAYLDAARCALVKRAVPVAPLAGVRMARERMFVDDSKAVAQLGHRAGDVRDALARSVEWFRANGYLRS